MPDVTRKDMTLEDAVQIANSINLTQLEYQEMDAIIRLIQICKPLAQLAEAIQ